MNNKKLILGIAAGAAALAVAGVIVSRNRSKKRQFENSVADAKDNFKGKLNELKRKAGKELKNGGAKDAVNTAMDRANDWVSKTAKA